MAESEFEAIVRGQMPYTPREWTEFELDEEFTYLEPVSLVGLTAVNLYEERDKAKGFFLDIQHEVLALGNDRYSIAELDEARLAAIFADQRVGEFKRLYGRILSHIEQGQDEDDDITYEGAVEKGCRQEIWYVKKDHDVSRENTVQLVYFLGQIAELYLKEPEAHFSLIRSAL